MTRGSRIMLSVIVVFAAVLGVYYSRSGDGGAGVEGLNRPLDPLNGAVPAKPREAMVKSPEPQIVSPPRSQSSTGLLADAVQHGSGGKKQDGNAKLAVKPEAGGKAGEKHEILTLLNTAPLLPRNSQPAIKKPSPKPKKPVVSHQKAMTYTVVEDDSLYVIAERWFGDGSKWELIAKLNPAVDPERLRIGQVLQMPPKSAGKRAVRTGGDTEGSGGKDVYVVESGDTLSSIASDRYGESFRWRLIFEANRALLGDPDDLAVGMKLVIPVEKD